jgi:purine-binding chemotaxis protein CheW
VSELHVVCKIADAAYVLPAADVLQMASYDGATRVPGAAAQIAGLVQIRGRVVPVLDMRVVFGFSAVEPTINSRVVVMQHGERTVGFLVDSAREVLKIPAQDFQPPPPVVVAQTDGLVKAVVQAGSRLLMLIDFIKVIGEEQDHGQ